MPRIRLVLTAICLVAAVLAAGFLLLGEDDSASHSRLAEAAASAEPGAIVQQTRDGPVRLFSGLYVLDRESGDVRLVLEQDGFDVGPGYGAIGSFEWTQDGSKLVANSTGFMDKLTVVAADGSNREQIDDAQVWTVQRLDNGRFMHHLRHGGVDGVEHYSVLDVEAMTLTDLPYSSEVGSVSPDGHYALTSQRQLVLTDLDSRIQTTLRTGEYFNPVWAPDSRHFAVQAGNAVQVIDRTDPAAAVVLPSAGYGPVWSPDSRWIAVSRVQTGSFHELPDLQIAAADGSVPPRVLGTGANPAWSPDGKTLAFVRDGELWELDVESGTETRRVVTPLPVITEARWSPDGRQLAFRSSGTGTKIVSAKGDGSEATALAPGFSPTWSPDGERIAFFSGYSGLGFGGSIYVMNADGTGIKRLAEVGYSDAITACSGRYYEWSPDGKTIAYWTDYGLGDDGPSVGIVPSDGSAPPLALARGTVPSWSPDGRQLAFTPLSRTTLACSVAIMEARPGAEVTVLATEAALADWSPDGEWVLFRRVPYQPSQSTASLIAVSIADPSRIVDFGPGYRSAWTPDGSGLVSYQQLEPKPGPSQYPYAAGVTSGVLVYDEFKNAGLAPVPSVRGPDHVEIPVTGSVEGISWRPDGRGFVYSLFSSTGEIHQLFSVSLDDPGSSRLMGEGTSPAWSPDGERLLFVDGF